MTYSTYKGRFKPSLFRVFCSNKYFENRDEYDRWGGTQPHTLEEFISKNLAELKRQFKLSKKENI